MKTRFYIAVTAMLAFGLALDVSVCSFAQAQPPGRDRAGDRGAEGRGGRGDRAGGMRGGFAGGGMMMGGGDPVMGLLRSADVRKELSIEPAQEEALKKIEEQIRAEPRGEDRPSPRDFDFRNASEEKRAEFFEKIQADQKKQAEKHRDLLEEVLLPGQMERLDELALQRRGLLALADPEIQKAIGLSTAQFDKLQQVRSEQETAIREKMRELFQSGDRGEMREKMTAVRGEMEQAVLGVLTPEQQSKFKEMKGKPFEFGDDAGAGRFGRGGERGARGGDQGDRGARGGDRGGRGGGRGGRGGDRQ